MKLTRNTKIPNLIRTVRTVIDGNGGQSKQNVNSVSNNASVTKQLSQVSVNDDSNTQNNGFQDLSRENALWIE